MMTYAQMVRQHAARTPQAPALSFGDRSWSYAEFDAQTSQTAAALQAAGVQPGDRVALLTKNQAECCELIVACSKLGAIFVGLNWRLAALELEAIIADAQPALLIVGGSEQPLLTARARATASLRAVLTLGAEFDAWRAAAPVRDPGREGAPAEVALLLYTSGTTGQPKGVALTNANMAYTQRLGEAWGMGPGSVNLAAMPIFPHVKGLQPGVRSGRSQIEAVRSQLA